MTWFTSLCSADIPKWKTPEAGMTTCSFYPIWPSSVNDGSLSYSNSSPQGELLLQFLLASLKLFQLLQTSRHSTVKYNSPLCSRRWSNRMQSLSSQIWLLSEVPGFCQHKSSPSFFFLSCQTVRSAIRSSLMGAQNGWIQGAARNHMRLNRLHMKNQETLKNSISGELFWQKSYQGRQLAILF